MLYILLANAELILLALIVIVSISAFFLLKQNENRVLQLFDNLEHRSNTDKWRELRKYLNLTITAKAKRVSKRNHLRFCTSIANGFYAEIAVKNFAIEIFHALDRFSQLAILRILAEKNKYFTAMFLADMHESDRCELELALRLIEVKFYDIRLPYESLSVIAKSGYSATLRNIFKMTQQVRLINDELKSATTHNELTDTLTRIYLSGGSPEGLDPCLFHHFEAALTEVIRKIGPLDRIYQHEIRQQFEITTNTLMKILLPFWRATSKPEHEERLARLLLTYSRNPHWLQVIAIYAARIGYSERQLRGLLDYRLDGKLHNSSFRSEPRDRRIADAESVVRSIDNITLDLKRAIGQSDE